jgi:hypothetical protein
MRTVVTASILLLASGGYLHADAILSTYCRVPLNGGGEIAVRSTGECSVEGPLVEPFRLPSSAYALAATDSGLLPLDSEYPEGTFGATVIVQTQAIFVGEPEAREYSTATANAELNLHASSTGPVRNGLIEQFNWGWSDTGGAANNAEVRVVVGNLSGVVWPDGCRDAACSGTFPFVLGQPFDIRLSAFSQSWGDNLVGGSGAATQWNIRFKLRELDGTPVDLLIDSEPPAAVPEPSTLLLLGPSLLLLGRLARRRIAAAPREGGRSGQNPFPVITRTK